MKSFVPLFALVLALASAACNDGGVVGGASEPEPTPEPTEEATPTPVPTPPLPAEADIAISLFWDDLGLDWELHLVKPGGQINDNATDCTWTSCIYTSPDWGIMGDASDDPHKDIDDTDTHGPERIWQADPENGVFTVLVEHWGSGSDEADGHVKILAGGVETTVYMENLRSHHVWTVATIELPSGVVTTTDAVYDCSANWSAGCLTPLP